MKVVHEKDLVFQELVGRRAVVFFGEGSGSACLTHSVAYFDVGHAPGHKHASAEVFFVDHGEGEVWMDGVPYALRSGTIVHTPGQLEHSVHTRPNRPLRLVAYASPHMVPGSYADLPPRSWDMAEVPTNISPNVSYEPADAATGRALGLSVGTKRIDVSVRGIVKGAADTIAAGGRDTVVHVLDGSGEIRQLDRSVQVSAGSAILLTGSEEAVLAATTDLRFIVGRATGERSHPRRTSRQIPRVLGEAPASQG